MPWGQPNWCEMSAPRMPMSGGPFLEKNIQSQCLFVWGFGLMRDLVTCVFMIRTIAHTMETHFNFWGGSA